MTVPALEVCSALVLDTDELLYEVLGDVKRGISGSELVEVSGSVTVSDLVSEVGCVSALFCVLFCEFSVVLNPG